MSFDIIIAGVGGQGTVLASRMLAQAAMEQGLAVRTAENIGMAQREGSVQSHVRIGQLDYGPLIPEGQADLLIAFEPAEAARSLSILKPQGTALINQATVVPVTVSLGQSKYPEEAIVEHIRHRVPSAKFIPAADLATAAGNFRTANVVMLGAVAGLGIMPFSAEALLQTMLSMVPEKVRDVNRKAFEAGMESVSA